MSSFVELLKQNKCICKKSKDPILLSDCMGFKCPQWKSCMKKSNNLFSKERGDKSKNHK